ncbi:ankyrin-1-like [Trichogramma pretiosum]|uniref:ankyrin-1-like n=1 Tax=Trichogramma pretiosum TaxID=7493 RepID=UPI0006C97067|nr:ankyrin-1-like [Trichogramma pretiosum]
MADDVKCLKKLKALREGVNWEIEEERRELLDQLDSLISDWEGQLPNLRDIFRREEIDWLLTESIDGQDEPTSLMDFVIKTGYKDEPEAGLTHFHMACEYCLEDIVEKFLDHGQDPNGLWPPSGEPLIHWAETEGSQEMFELLLRRGADPNLPNKDGLTLLQIICSSGDDALADIIFEHSSEKYQVQLDTRDKLGNTPLHTALEKGFKYIAELLLTNGADPNAVKEDGTTPLHIICNQEDKNYHWFIGNAGDDSTLELFFKVNEEKHQVVRIDAQDKMGNTALHLALLRDDQQMVELLLRKDADPNLANNEGLTPLHIVCKRRVDYENDEYDDYDYANEFFNIIDEKRQTLRVDARDNLGNTPLHYAVADDHRENTIEKLLSKGVELNLTNQDGSTPLHVICTRDPDPDDDLPKTFLKLVDDFGDWLQFDTRDKRGRTPMQLAVANFMPHVMRALFKHGTHLYNHAMSNFTFPTESYFGERYNSENKFQLASGALAVVEQLETRRYNFGRSNALTVMKFFRARGLFDKSADDPHKSWCDDKVFTNKAKNTMVAHGHTWMTLYQLIQLRPEKAAKELTYWDYYKLAFSDPVEEAVQACAEHLCEKVARGFFLRWALDPFLEMTSHQLPTECSDMIIKQLMNEDLCNICLAAASQN